MNITDASENQFEIAIDMFLTGSSISYHEVVFCITREGEFQVNSYADFIHRENITADHAREKIERSKHVLADLCSRSERFAAKVESLPARYYCCYDYGTAAVVVAEEKDGEVRTW